MNFLRADHRTDFGDEYYIQFLNLGKSFPRPLKDKSVIQVSVSWDETPGWPYLQITMGNSGLFGLLFCTYKISFVVDFFSHTWRFNHLKSLNND